MTVNVRADVYPTTVRVNGVTTYERVRVILVGGEPERVFIYKDGAQGPELAFSSEATSYDPPHTPQRLREAFQPMFVTYTIKTPDITLTFEKAGGCGCGSRLKSFNPFPSISSLSAT